MATGKALNGKPYAGNPHVRFDEGEVAPAATPRRGSLLYKNTVLACAGVAAAMVSFAEVRPHVRFYAPDIVRIVKCPSGDVVPAKMVEVVTMRPGEVAVAEEETSAVKTWRSSALAVTLDKASGTFAFADAKGRPLLAERGPAEFRRVRRGDLRARQAFALEKDEPIYGLGLLQNGKLSQRGEKRWLLPENKEEGIPFVQSVKGWALYWDEVSPVRFEDGEEGMSFESDATDAVDYYFMAGGSIDGNVAAMRRLTGDVPMFPLWTYGFWQSRERYRSQQELLDVLKTYRRLDIPLDGIIQDWQYWGGNERWNAMDFRNSGFPDPQKMVDEVHALNAHVIISIWSAFGTNTEQYARLDKIGALYRGFTTYPPAARAYDAFSPAARDIYWRHLYGLARYGFDGWWMDSTEPEPIAFKADDVDRDGTEIDLPTYLGPLRRVRCAYPLVAVGNVYEKQRAAAPDKRVFILTRCGFAGQQRYGANVWSGDIDSTWDVLRRQVTAGLNFSMSGVPHYNCDIGGFFPKQWKKDGGPRNPGFHELYVRWMQFGAFMPMMRSHGTGFPREFHICSNPGERTYEALVAAVRLRYRLLPYTYSLSREVSDRRASFMRPLAADFAADRRTWDIGDEFLYGRAFLVAPVLEPGATERKVVLPSGAEWWDFRANKRHAGGTEPTVPAPWEHSPVFVRAGSIVPLGPDVQYAAEKKWDDLEVCVYPGADGTFTLYEDEGDGYACESGTFTEICFSWNDVARELSIDRRKGAFPGMLSRRVFRVRLPGGETHRVEYDGAATKVCLGQ